MQTHKVPYLKRDRGRLFYRRRIPKRHQKTLGQRVWNRPCGKVSLAEAVAQIHQWTKEDDALIRRLDNPKEAEKVRYVTEIEQAEPAMMKFADTLTDLGMEPGEWQGSQLIEFIRTGIRTADEQPEQSPAARLVAYRTLLLMFFGNHVEVPRDPDQRDEYDLLKRKVERRVADLAGDPNTINSVAMRYYDYATLKPGVRAKYRRNIQKLINHVGDIPLSQLTPAKLREFRDAQSATMQLSSLHAVFTPIKGMLNYAMGEEIIDTNPYGSVHIRRETRSVEARRWKPFTPEEAQRILVAAERRWSTAGLGLTDERRLGIWMIVRVLAYTGMRPKEVIWLEPHDISDRWVRIEDSKTVGSERVIPLHPKIRDFPQFVRSGGLKTFESQKKDRVQSVRHNFYRLTREVMDPPLSDPRKVLYSWRSTFSNAMRRAGASPDMRRAILGHVAAGALRHYEDGPEFFEKRKWVSATDPTRVYLDPGEDDDLE